MAVALVNTDERAVAGHDHLVSLDDLNAFLEHWHELWDGDSQPPEEDDVTRVDRLRRRLRSVFEAETEQDAVATLNLILVDNGAVPRVSLHGGEPHMHFEPGGDAFSRWLAVVTGMGLATVLVDQGLARFGTCAAGDCRDVFVDTSRNRSRRHCSTTCSTREAVAAHRRRRREERG
jgi:predicted RNA-binding Zn ribbon-like protein